MTIQTTFLARKDFKFLDFAGIGASIVDGLFETLQGAPPTGDGAMATGAGAAAGGDGMIVVLNGFPSFLQGNAIRTNLKDGNKATNSFILKPYAKQLIQE